MQEINETITYRKALKGKILECAMKAFTQHGVKAVRMDDVASLLGISKRTLYEVYKDKEELLFEGVKKYGGERKDSFVAFAQAADNVIEVVLELYRLKVEESRLVNPQFYADMQKYPKVMQYIKDSHDRSRTEMEQFFARGVSEGYFRGDVNSELALQLFDAIEQYVVGHSLIEKFSFEDLFGNMVLVTLRGLCTLKGIMALDEAVALRRAQISENERGISEPMPSTM